MNITLCHGNNLEILPTLPGCSVDSIVTDPPYELGFMGKKWDASGIAYNVALWTECLRVLKPGGHLLAFGGTRTYHRMAVAIEDAGFEIRDSIHWIYGSGFPKSLNVSKSIEALLTTGKAQKNGFHNLPGKALGGGTIGMYEDVEEQGFRKRQPKQHGARSLEPTTDEARTWDGWGTALKPAHEPIVVARKPLAGTVANNVLTHGTGALNIDGTRIHRDPTDVSHAGRRTATFGTQETVSGGDGSGGWEQNDVGRWPANIVFTHAAECGDDCAPSCPIAALDAQSDGASRFFTVTEWSEFDVPFRYVAKPSKKERNAGSENNHPTVKPVALMRWLVRLVTPPDGTVLDPFAGSGTTLVSATLEGMNAIGIELTDDYLPIIKGRIEWAKQQPPTLL